MYTKLRAYHFRFLLRDEKRRVCVNLLSERRESRKRSQYLCIDTAENKLSITRELWTNGQTRQRWSNMNQYSVTVILIHLWSEFASDWELPLLNEQSIGTLFLWNDLWLAEDFIFFKAWKQSHEEVQKSIFLSEHLNYNMLKGYYDIVDAKSILPTNTLNLTTHSRWHKPSNFLFPYS